MSWGINAYRVGESARAKHRWHCYMEGTMAGFVMELRATKWKQMGEAGPLQVGAIVPHRSYLRQVRSPQLKPRCLWRERELKLVFRPGPERRTI